MQDGAAVVVLLSRSACCLACRRLSSVLYRDPQLLYNYSRKSTMTSASALLITSVGYQRSHTVGAGVRGQYDFSKLIETSDRPPRKMLLSACSLQTFFQRRFRGRYTQSSLPLPSLLRRVLSPFVFSSPLLSGLVLKEAPSVSASRQSPCQEFFPNSPLLGSPFSSHR